MYDEFSNDYDRFVNWNNRLAGEMPFIERLLAGLNVKTNPARVLDAACGTGMHAIALAERGFAAAGADLSVNMVERARENARHAGVAVDFKAVGFGELAGAFGAQTFDAVICLGNSLPHLLTLQALAAALNDFAACLRPGGLLLIQNRNFDAVLSRKERWMEPQAHEEDGREWLFLRFYDFLPDGLIDFNIVTLYRERGKGWSQRVSSTTLRPLREADLVAALQDAGFQRVERYGGLAGNNFDAQSSGNLVVAAYY